MFTSAWSTSQATNNVPDEFNQFFNFDLGYTAQLELYLYIPPSLDISRYGINHYCTRTVAKWLPPPGTYTRF